MPIDLAEHTGVATELLGYFTNALNNGGQKLVAASTEFCGVCVALQLLLSAAEATMSRRMLMSATAKFMGVVLWYSVATNIVSLADGYIQWMGSLGAQIDAGGGGAVMQNPSNLLDVGLKTVKGMGKVTHDLSILTAGFVLMLMCFTAVLVLLGFAVMVCIAVFVVVMSYISAVVGCALIPFAVLPGTRFLATPGIGLIVQAGISLGTTSVVLSVGHMVMQALLARIPPEGASLRHAFNVFLASALVSVLSGGCAMLGKIAGAAVSGAIKTQRLLG